MYIYIILVLFVTLMPLTISFDGHNKAFIETANFIPFRDLRLHYGGAIREIILNIIMMLPFGFLYPIVRKKGLIKTVIMTFCFSLFIEISQLLGVWWDSSSTRIFDVTDLTTNSFGGVLGYFLFAVLRKISINLQKERYRIPHRTTEENDV